MKNKTRNIIITLQLLQDYYLLTLYMHHLQKWMMQLRTNKEMNNYKNTEQQDKENLGK